MDLVELALSLRVLDEDLRVLDEIVRLLDEIECELYASLVRLNSVECQLVTHRCMLALVRGELAVIDGGRDVAGCKLERGPCGQDQRVDDVDGGPVEETPSARGLALCCGVLFQRRRATDASLCGHDG